MTTTRPTPTDPTVPPGAVPLAPAPPETVPLRNPAGTWALVITTVRLAPLNTNTPPDPAHTDTADVFAGIWLPAPPSAHVHRGDVLLRLTPPADNDPARADVRLLVATTGNWRTAATFPALDKRWPHHVATTVVTWMRALADEAEGTVSLRAFTASIGIDRAPVGLLPGGLGDAALLRPDAPDALADLIDAGLVAVGDQLVWNGHTATVCHGGALVWGTEPHELGNSAVSALATSLATPTTVNGWHLWRRARDDRPLAQLRADLATTPPHVPPDVVSPCDRRRQHRNRLGVGVDTVIVRDDPDRHHGIGTNTTPGDLIEVTSEGRCWYFIQDLTGFEPLWGWLLLGPCPFCEATAVPVARVAGLADLGAYLDPETEHYGTDAAPVEFDGDPGHHPHCPHARATDTSVTRSADQ